MSYHLKQISEIKKYIINYIKEEFHTSEKPGVPYNNSLQTLDNGNINFEACINKYYKINEYYDYDSKLQKSILLVKLRKNYIKKFKSLGIDTKSYKIESHDHETFKVNKRQLIEKIYTNLSSRGLS